MTRFLCTAILFSLACPTGKLPAAPPEDRATPLEEAAAAMADGVPDVAIIKLRKAAAEQQDPAQRAQLSQALAEACVAAGRGEEALAALENTKPGPGTDLIRASALALLGRWEEAESAYRAVAAQNEGDASLKALFAEAEMARMQQAWDRAMPLYKRLLDSPTLQSTARLRLAAIALDLGDVNEADRLLNQEPEDPQNKDLLVLRARIKVAKGNNGEALELLELAFEKPEGLTPELAATGTLVRAEALKRKERIEEARKTLERYVQDNPASPYLRPVIDRLTALEKGSPSGSDALTRWSNEGPAARQGLAIYSLAELSLARNDREAARKEFSRFLDPGLRSHLLSSSALRKLAQIQAAGSDWSGALATLENLAQTASPVEALELGELRARIAIERGEYRTAGEIYEKLAGPASLSEEQKFYFAALAALWKGEEQQFLSAYEEFSRRYPASTSRPSLLLDRGLFFARTGDNRAAETLKRFLEEFPKEPRAAEAKITLAELAFKSTPSDSAAATEWLNSATDIPPSDPLAERAEYLRIWILDAQGAAKSMECLSRARRFAEQWPRSAFLPSVLMKTGELYFRQEDYANAQAAFQRIAGDFADDPLADQANYLAGICMLRTMNPGALDQAIPTLEKVARRESPLAARARLAQAEAYMKQGKESDALVFYEDILKTSPPADIRAAALCGKGEMLFVRAAKDSKQLEPAIEAFDAVVRDAEIPSDIKQEALWRKGKAFETAENTDAALEAYYEAVRIGDANTVAPGGELFWYYKAGFDAGRILESRSRWPAAAALYEKLAAVGGPRSQEATARANRLRLEHFLWEERER